MAKPDVMADLNKITSKSPSLAVAGMLIVLLLFLYPHIILFLQGFETTQSAKAFQELIQIRFPHFTTALSVSTFLFIMLKMGLRQKPKREVFHTAWLLLMIASLFAFNIDVYMVFKWCQSLQLPFSKNFVSYWQQTEIQYLALFLSSWLSIVLGILSEGQHKPLFGYAFIKTWGKTLIVLIPGTYLLFPLLLCLRTHTSLIGIGGNLDNTFLFTAQSFSIVQNIVLISVIIRGLNRKELSRGFLTQQLKLMLVISGLLFATELLMWTKYSFLLSNQTIWPYHEIPSWGERFKNFLYFSAPLITFSVISYALWRYHHTQSKLGEDETNTSGDFGSARFATRDDFKKLSFYDETVGPILGKDEDGHAIYTPLVNKLIISPPGGGKTTASSIPLLLQHEGPAFVFDVKGELWAVTAEHRRQTMGRKIVTIDPFNITRQPSFAKNIEETLFEEHHINPFDSLPSDPQTLDRIINAFAASFLIMNDKLTSHFDENAKILIRGYIDYLVRSDHIPKTLPELFKLLSAPFEDNKTIMEKMIALGGRAMAAAHQLDRVGSNERGSILSTTYRQIDWLGDSNVNRILNDSTFKLKDFLKGNMDIYVIIPEDQVKEHARLMRMMMALLMGQIIQADPNDLPDKKIVFLLEELAQMGNYPDVEQCIEVLRARNVVVWAVFQTLSQIELFEKPDLFKSAALKQIFTTDDVKTMEWIQNLGGEKTILTKSKSEDKGKSRHSSQWLSGTTSSGQGQSIHETGVDLLLLNEIREMDKNTQLVFYTGAPVIKCRKAYYFEDKKLKKLAGVNPLA